MVRNQSRRSGAKRTILLLVKSIEFTTDPMTGERFAAYDPQKWADAKSVTGKTRLAGNKAFRDKFGRDDMLSDNQRVGVRLNINFLNTYQVPVQSIHTANTQNPWNEPVVAYAHAVTVRDPQFQVHQRGAYEIAHGLQSKHPMAAVVGGYVPTDPERHRVDGQVIVFNPRRSHLFTTLIDGEHVPVKGVRGTVTVHGTRVYAHPGSELEYWGSNAPSPYSPIKKSLPARRVLLIKSTESEAGVTPQGNAPKQTPITTTGKLSTSRGSGFRLQNPGGRDAMDGGLSSTAIRTHSEFLATDKSPMDARYGSIRVLEAMRRRDSKQGANPSYSAAQLRTNMAARSVPSEEIHWAGLGEGFAPSGSHTIDAWHRHVSAHLPRFATQDDSGSAFRFSGSSTMPIEGLPTDPQPFMTHVSSYLPDGDERIVKPQANLRINQMLADSGYFHKQDADNPTDTDIGHIRGYSMPSGAFLKYHSPETKLPHGVDPDGKHVHTEEVQSDYRQHPGIYTAAQNIDQAIDKTEGMLARFDSHNQDMREYERLIGRIGHIHNDPVYVYEDKNNPHLMATAPATSLSPFYDLQDVIQPLPPLDTPRWQADRDISFQYDPMASRFRTALSQSQAKQDDSYDPEQIANALLAAHKYAGEPDAMHSRLEDVVHSMDASHGLDRTSPEMSRIIRQHFDTLARRWEHEASLDLYQFAKERNKKPDDRRMLSLRQRFEDAYGVFDLGKARENISKDAERIRGFGRALTSREYRDMDAVDALWEYSRWASQTDPAMGINTKIASARVWGDDSNKDAMLSRKVNRLPTANEVLKMSTHRQSNFASSGRSRPVSKEVHWTAPIVGHLTSKDSKDAFQDAFVRMVDPYVNTGGRWPEQARQWVGRLLDDRERDTGMAFDEALPGEQRPILSKNEVIDLADKAEDNRYSPQSIETRRQDMQELASAWWKARQSHRDLATTPDENKAVNKIVDALFYPERVQTMPVENRQAWHLMPRNTYTGELDERHDKAIERPVRKHARFLAMAALAKAINEGAQTVSFPTAWFQNGHFEDRTTNEPQHKFFLRHYKEVGDAVRTWIKEHGGEVRDIPFSTANSRDESKKHNVTVPWAVVNDQMREAMKEHGVDTFGVNSRRNLESLSKAVQARRPLLIMKGLLSGSQIAKANEPTSVQPVKPQTPQITTTGKLSTEPGSGFRLFTPEPAESRISAQSLRFVPYGTVAANLRHDHNSEPLDARYGSLRVLEATRRRDAKKGSNPLYSASQLRQNMLSRNVPAEEIHWAGIGEGFAPEGKKTIDDWHVHASAHLPRFYTTVDNDSAERYFDSYSVGARGHVLPTTPWVGHQVIWPFMHHVNSYLPSDDHNAVDQPRNADVNGMLEDKGFYHLPDLHHVNIGHVRGFETTPELFLKSHSPNTGLPHGVNGDGKHVHIEEIQSDYRQHPSIYAPGLPWSEREALLKKITDEVLPIMDERKPAYENFDQAVKRMGASLSEITKPEHKSNPHLLDLAVPQASIDPYQDLHAEISGVVGDADGGRLSGRRFVNAWNSGDSNASITDNRQNLASHLALAVNKSLQTDGLIDQSLEETLHLLDRQAGIDRTHPVVSKVIHDYYDDLARKYYLEAMRDIQTEANKTGLRDELFDSDRAKARHQSQQISDFARILTHPDHAGKSSLQTLESTIGPKSKPQANIERIFSPDSFDSSRSRINSSMPDVRHVLSASLGRKRDIAGRSDNWSWVGNSGHTWTNDLVKAMGKYGHDKFVEDLSSILTPYIRSGGTLTDEMKSLGREQSRNSDLFDKEVSRRRQRWAQDARHNDVQALGSAAWHAKKASKPDLYVSAMDDARKLMHHAGDDAKAPIEPVENRASWNLQTDSMGESSESNVALERPVRKYGRFLSMAAIAKAIKDGADTISFPTAWFQNGDFVDRKNGKKENQFFLRHYADTANVLRAFAKEHGEAVRDIPFETDGLGSVTKDNNVTVPYMVVNDAMRRAIDEHGVDAFGPGLPSQLRELSKAVQPRRIVLLAKGLK